MSKSKGCKVPLAESVNTQESSQKQEAKPGGQGPQEKAVLFLKMQPWAGDTVHQESTCLECAVLGSNPSTNKKGWGEEN